MTETEAETAAMETTTETEAETIAAETTAETTVETAVKTIVKTEVRTVVETIVTEKTVVIKENQAEPEKGTFEAGNKDYQMEQNGTVHSVTVACQFDYETFSRGVTTTEHLVVYVDGAQAGKFYMGGATLHDDFWKDKASDVNVDNYFSINGDIMNIKINNKTTAYRYDETSPHLHVVGVPIKYKSKNGMSKQVGKGDVFTRDSLRTIQDKMRTLCIASFNKEYGLNNILKKKEKGRNKDINVKDMTNYQAMKEELNKNKEALEIASKKSSELDKTTNDIKDTINNLKKAPIVKNTYTISESDRNKIIDYVDKVQDTNKDFKKTEMLSVTLNNVDTELQENREKIKILTENNKALTLKVDTLSKNIDNKNKEIKELKNDNKHLQEMVDYFKNLFRRLVKFIKNKMFGKEKEREDYWKVSKDMYEHGIFSEFY